jgi:hypothetical protein
LNYTNLPSPKLKDIQDSRYQTATSSPKDIELQKWYPKAIGNLKAIESPLDIGKLSISFLNPLEYRQDVGYGPRNTYHI